MARFFLPQKNIEGSHGIIDGQELTHLRKVLRLRPGDAIILFDDAGRQHDALIDSLDAEQAQITIVRSYEAQSESPLYVTLAVGLTKGEKLDWVVEKATELGVQRIVPFASAYSVPTLDAQKVKKRTERWHKIAVSAAKQCGRTRVPEIDSLMEFSAFIRRPWPETLRLLFWENETEQSLYQTRERHCDTQSALLAIGPEGGFTGAEAESAKAQGFETVRIGRRVLRAETAAIAALTLVQFLWGDLR
jgi:16S rRNA (uracil1498-N3)-methyltransferase